MPFEFSHLGKTYKGALSLERYASPPNLAVSLLVYDDEYGGWDRYTRLSINPDHLLMDGEFVAKTYSENEGLVEPLVEAGYFEPSGKSVLCGYAGPMPVLRITDAGKAAGATG